MELLVYSNNKYIKAKLIPAVDGMGVTCFSSFTRLREAADKTEDMFSLLIDEDVDKGSPLEFFYDQADANPRFSKMVVLTRKRKGQHGHKRYGKLSFLPRDSVEKELLEVLGEKTPAYRAEKKRASSIILGSSAPIERLRRRIDVVGAGGCDAVVVFGETGSGKELVAKALHATCSPGDPVVVNCALLDSAAADSLLFGHNKGAYTSCEEESEGMIAMADGGTLVLDEFEELPPSVQAKLLRFMDTREFHRYNNPRLRKVKCRVVALTNKSVAQLYGEGKLRTDFYNRLAQETIIVPPLRDRLSDIPELVRHREEQMRWGDPIENLGPFMRHPWKGNVRELFYAVDRVHRNGAVSEEEIAAAINAASGALEGRF